MSCALYRIILLALTMLFLSSPKALANADFSYGGWLSDGGGNALSGTIDIDVRYYNASTGGTLLHGPDTYSGITLNEGVFQIDISLTDSEAHTIFSNPTVFIEIEDTTNGNTHPRARFSVAPFALKIPVDGSSLTYDASGVLSAATAADCNAGEYLDGDGSCYAIPTDTDTNTNADTICASGKFLGGGGDGCLAVPADSHAGTKCVAGQYLDGDGSCKTIPVDTDTNASTQCASGKVLGGGADGCIVPGGAGDITDVVAGTGLTGGAVTGSASLAVDVGTSVGQIVQVVTGGKLPALDGSNLSSVTASSVLAANTSGLTAGSIAFSDGSGLIQDNANLFFDNGAKRMGIGTTTPSAGLHIHGSHAVEYPALRLQNTDTTAGAVTAMDMRLFNGTSGLRILQSANAAGPAWSTGSYDALILTSQSGSDLHFAAGNTATPHLTIESSGNVGIGSTTPTEALDVVGSIKIVDGSEGLNKVLTSDAAGVGTWTALPGGGDMLKATYDANSDGIVEDSTLLAGQTSAYHLDTDNHTDGTTNKVFLATEKTKLTGIETLADVTDAANVAAAGAVMDADFSASDKALVGTAAGTFAEVDVASANTASSIVKRDGSGNFTAGTITATLTGNASTATSAATFTDTMVGDVTGVHGATQVDAVGNKTTAQVVQSVDDTLAATAAATVSTIVKRDGNGDFTAVDITATTFTGDGSALTNISASPAGADTQLQFNDGGSTTGGDANLAWNKTKGILKVVGAGTNNMFIGDHAGFSNTTGTDNVFSGYQAGYSNTGGLSNIFTGTQAGYTNTDGHSNVFSGYYAGYSNTTGNSNVFNGSLAGYSNTTGVGNVFTGFEAGHSNTTGDNNVAIGNNAGRANTVGDQNTFIGKDAGNTGTTNNLTNATAIGYNAQVTASNSLILGNAANVGIGTTAPTAMLEVAGQFVTTLPSALIPSGTTETVDFNNGNGQVLDLGTATGDVTLTLSNPVAGGSYTIKVIQGATARTITWPASTMWPGGIPITLSTTNDAIDLVTLFYDGTNFLAAAGVNYQ